MRIALPDDAQRSATNNTFDKRIYLQLCREFWVDENSDWRIKGGNQGLGRVYFTDPETHEVKVITHYGNTHLYESVRQTFEKSTDGFVFQGGKLLIDFIKQDQDAANTAWNTYILDNLAGFTASGIARINDSIRTYVWAIVGAQVQTRSEILGVGTSFDAQKQFQANVEDAINSPVDIPSSIRRYQNVLQNASSKVDYVFGTGLYMAPSDMSLAIGDVAGYNNLNTIATEEQQIGSNADVNLVPVFPDRGSFDLPPDTDMELPSYCRRNR